MVLHLQRDRLPLDPAAAQTRRDPIGERQELPPHRPPIAQVVVVGVLVADRLRLAFRLDGAVVDPAGQFVQVLPVRAERSHQRLPRRAAQIPDRPDPPSEELLLRHLPHPPQLPHGKRVEKRLLSSGGNDREAVRLPQIRRDLREELVRRNAGGNGQPRLFPDRRLDLARHFFRGAEQPLAPRDVEERLVDGERFDQRGEPAVDGEDRVGDLRIAGHADGQEDPLRAEPLRGRRRHRRMDPEFSRRVRSGRHDAATLVAAHDHRLPEEFRAIEDLHRGVERVQIQVQDAP